MDDESVLKLVLRLLQLINKIVIGSIFVQIRLNNLRSKTQRCLDSEGKQSLHEYSQYQLHSIQASQNLVRIQHVVPIRNASDPSTTSNLRDLSQVEPSSSSKYSPKSKSSSSNSVALSFTGGRSAACAFVSAVAGCSGGYSWMQGEPLDRLYCGYCCQFLFWLCYFCAFYCSFCCISIIYFS